MKKMTKLATLFLCVIMIISSLTACSIFSNQPDSSGSGGGGDDPQPKTQTINIFNGDTPTTYTVTLGEVAEIDVFTKPGYYFVGAYDSAEDGTKYFDGNGNSTMVWGAGNPDTYYVRFESIYNLTYTAKQREEDPYKWNGVSEKYVTFAFSDELKNAVSANLDANVVVNVSVDISCDSSWSFKDIDLKTLKSGGETYVLGENEQLAGGTYKTFTYSATIPTRLLQSGEIHLYLKGLDSNLINAAYYYYKNVSIAITFENA